MQTNRYQWDPQSKLKT
uniref:Uncharacterized protein n=1 Tax=Moniliophthora roreri TaxID=221103 RepID=A0A0W0G0P6_MONRR